MYQNSDRYTDDEGYMYIGISESILYNITDGDYQVNDFPYIMEQIRRSNSESDIIHMTDLLSVSRDVFEDAVEEYKVTLAKNTSELIPSDNTVIWHPGKVKNIKIPTTLSKNIGVGDILYFYTDESIFAATGQVEYMVVITEELLGADIDTLINAADVVNPFEYSVMESDVQNNRAVINNITSVMAASDTMGALTGFDNFQLKSIENTLSQEDTCTLRVISANYISQKNKKLGIFGLYAAGSNFSSGDTSWNTGNKPVYSMGCYNKDNEKFVLETSNKHLAIENLAVNINNAQMNFELTDIVYDKNIQFRNGYFIYDGLTEDNLATEYVMTSLSSTPVQNFMYTIQKRDFFRDPDVSDDILDDYYIGYCLTHNGQVIAEEETLNNTLDVDIQPIEFLKHNFCIWCPQTYYLKDDYTRGKAVYDKLMAAEQSDEEYNPSSSDEAVVTQLENNKLTGYDYEVVFTVRNKRGFRYYSNPTIVSFLINSTPRNFIGAQYKDEVEAVLVDVKYPDEIELGKDTKETSGNILWDFEMLTADKNILGDNTLEIHTADDSITIKSVLLNSRDITKLGTVKNNWITLSKKENSEHECVYDVLVNDNIPDIKDSDGNVYSTTSAEDYMRLLADDTLTFENSRLFSILDRNYKPMSTKDRAVILTVVYEKDGIECFEKFTIRQPGFQDPRTIPGVNMKLSSCFDELSEVNTIDNGVLCNQFRTYLDLEITGFDISNWGSYGTDDVYIDIELKNVQYDNQQILKYNIENPYRRPTFKFITMDEYAVARLMMYDRYSSYRSIPSSSVIANRWNMERQGTMMDNYNDIVLGTRICQVFPDLMNHYELGFRSDAYADSFSVSQDVYLTSNISGKKHSNVYSEDNKTYVIMDSDLVRACQKPYEPSSGMFHDIKLKFEKLPVKAISENNRIRVAVDFAMGNPIQCNMLLQFVVSEIKIHYKGSVFTLSAQKMLNSLMSHVYRNTRVYRYSSNTLDVMFNPVSLTACPVEEEANITQIQGAVKKTGSEDPIKVKVGFYNKSVYKSKLVNIRNIFTFNNIRVAQFWDRWDEMEIRSGYFQDNVTGIEIKAIDPVDVLDRLYTDSLEYEYTDKNIKNQAESSDLKGSKRYLSVVYNASETMNPKLREGRETFIFNNKEYEKDRYDQYLNESPMFMTVEGNLAIRDQVEIDSMDAWNFEYQVANPEYKTPDGLLIKGEKNTFGNGYLFLDNSYDNGQYIENGLLGLEELKKKAEASCIGLDSVIEMKDTQMKNRDYYPENGRIFRSLVYDLNWEYPWMLNGRVKHNLMVDSFGLLLDRLLKSGSGKPELVTADYKTANENLEKYSGGIQKTLSYNLCYDIFPRVGFNHKTGTTNVLMLRKPSIGVDTDSGTVNEAVKYLNLSKEPDRWHNPEDLDSEFIK